MDALDLQRREKALRSQVVSDISGEAHAAVDISVCEQTLELLAAVLATLIEVMQLQQLLRLAPPPNRHHERVIDTARSSK
jgi:hypothetical protein